MLVYVIDILFCSDGGVVVWGGVNDSYKGDLGLDIVNWFVDWMGNLWVDYVLFVKVLFVLGLGVFWFVEGLMVDIVCMVLVYCLVWVDLDWL